ncbi:MAG TPA: MotA/TolQ/ExbB proton channel family protein [Candidatus Paceibacterota bacterium]|nr:MotA/TolQ/ExbB proton channel family protein [Verrucomicrobiota bacterium]HRY51812.1 MotA/TolQ/ExbB proton channel family protein [Candidatus Paceibacterota bacterium]HSA02866.1 MotA/TolQ/ExbB proton channel family protein [Candidatus Paceibacterota bacterium]
MLDFLINGGPFMVPMVITSVVALAFIIERGLALRWKKVIPVQIEKAVEKTGDPEGLETLKRACAGHPSAISRLLVVAVEHLNWTKNENVDALQIHARHEIAKLERGLLVLEVVIGIAPLLGLVGTIHGLIRLFGAFGDPGVADSARLASGIAIALNMTLMGLLIAIPALVAWSYYSKKVETLSIEMETICDSFLRRQYRQKRRGQPKAEATVD